MTRSPIVSTLFVLTFAACGSSPKTKAPEDKPIPVEPTPPPAPTPPPEPPLLRLAGDDHVPERFRRAFSDFLAEDKAKTYQRVVEVNEVSNAVALVLESKVEDNGACYIGTSTVDLMQDAGPDAHASVESFGRVCCPGTTCTLDAQGWNLRWLAAVQAKDAAALASFAPAKKKLAYKLQTPDGKSAKSFSRKDIAAGKFVNPPGCGFVDSRPSCDAPDAKTGAFECHCNGGGYHVDYDWQKEGDGFVITAISESST